MRRAVLGLWTYVEFFGAAVFLLPAFAVVALWHRERDPGMRARGHMMRFFGRVTSSITPLWRFSVAGKAPVDVKQKGYVVVSNHASTSDPFLLSHLPFDMRFIAKEEIFKLPLLGWLMRLGGDIPLRRGDSGSVRRMFEACRRTLDAGVPVMIFPEGTRSPDGKLLPFKDGAFQLAIDAQAPLLPLALVGTHACRPKGSLWFGDARAVVKVLEPIPTAGLGPDDVPALRERCREVIQRAADELRAALSAEPVRPRAPLGSPRTV
ncbi:MAG: 1-acyl-sn-glycerol-3-phosphate acyltransferase [Deltaproteobacteria bacterium]|nr:1-acyl-sn-glycerol-3-phosphate acyltransferase [Deltaproteobacteria bacterium]